MTESTVTAASEPGLSMGLATRKVDMEEPEGNDEITEMLMRNERSNKAGIVIAGDDSDNKSDGSAVTP